MGENMAGSTLRCGLQRIDFDDPTPHPAQFQPPSRLSDRPFRCLVTVDTAVSEKMILVKPCCKLKVLHRGF